MPGATRYADHTKRGPPRSRKGVLHYTAFERRLVSMKNTLKLITIMVALYVDINEILLRPTRQEL